MRASRQDRHYLTTEADAFFERNHAQADPRVLRPHKRRIADQLSEAGVRPRRVLEYGCGYGDLLHHFSASGASECVGVEPSKRAVELGTSAYGARVRLVQGTIADNAVNADPAIQRTFDLVVVDDVFCWVSRETLFQSIANIDDALAEGGHLFIREFFPLANRRNRNHHVDGEDVYCHKPAGPHAAIFTASGVYAVVWQQVTMDAADKWVAGAGRDPFESRWSDVVLRKSSSDYWR
jgi:SAM-dependent methyltransferase